MTGKLPKKTNQAKLSPLPTCTQRKAGNQSFDCGHHTFKKRYASSSQPSNKFTQTRWHKGRDWTPSFQRHTMFRLYPNFEGNRPAQDALRTRSSHVSFRLHEFPGNNMSRATWQLNQADVNEVRPRDLMTGPRDPEAMSW